MVVVHAPCNDGFAAALIASWFRPDVRIFMVDHDQLASLDPGTSDGILFADISPTPAMYTQLINDGKKFAIIDHHASAEKDLVGCPAWLKWFDSSQSACVMVWRYFFGDAPLPPLFAIVQARDLFRKDDVPNCDIVITGLATCAGFCAACWTRYAVDHGELVAAGQLLDRKREDHIEKYVQAASLRTMGRQRFWAINCTQEECISDVGARLVNKEGCKDDIAFIYRYDTKRWGNLVSLRSRLDGPDVSQLAASWGGDGHRSAAGFTWRSPDIETFFVDRPLPSSGAVRQSLDISSFITLQ